MFFSWLFYRKIISPLKYFDQNLTQHKFNQRKQIKTVLARHKIHLLTACEIFNHKMCTFLDHSKLIWMEMNNDYSKKEDENYFFHAFVYRFLAVFAWDKENPK